MNYQILAAELALPAYAAMTDQQAADALNAKTVSADVETISGSDVFEATTQSDYSALTATQLRAILGQSTWSPAERVAVATMQVMLPLTQQLLALALAVHEAWLINEVNGALAAAAEAGQRVAGYDPAALGVVASAFNAIITAADTAMGEGLPTPRQAIMRIMQQVEV